MTIISNSNKKIEKIEKIKSEICKHIELYDDSKSNKDDKTELKLLISAYIYELLKENDQDTMNLIKDKNTMKLINDKNTIIGIAHGLCPKHKMSNEQIENLLKEMNIALPSKKAGGKKKTPTKKPVKKSPPKKNPTTKPKSKSKTMTDYKKDDLVKIAKRKDVSLTGRDKKPKTKEQLYRSLKYHKCI
jgi:hypothetical protein